MFVLRLFHPAGEGKQVALLLILTDQQTHNAMSNAGNPWLKTPAMDSLARTGTRFAETICPYPVCSPSRGSIFTGRMPHETGVRVNGKAIVPGMATMGEVFRKAGYQTVYGGKWHLPKSFDGMTSFEKLIGGSGQGKDMDEPLAATCAEWLRRRPSGPFLMVASFMNPHDICQWIRDHPGAHEYPDIGQYPPAPGNMAFDPLEPEAMQGLLSLTGVTFPVYWAGERAIEDYGLTGIPLLVILRNGKEAERLPGAKNEELLDERIRGLLQESGR